MPSTYKPLIVADLRGGRNGVDPPWSLRENECAEALNVDWIGATLGRKRGGADALAMTGTTFTGKISTLIRHVPSTDETAAELWGVDDAATPIINRLAGGSVWSAPTLKDSPAGNGWDVQGASLNGKLFLAYKSGSGFTNPGAPTVANTGSGSYAAVLRYYRVRWTQQVGGVTLRRSSPGTAQSFTPSGSGSAARVTQPTPPGQGETHWEIEVSYDNVTFYVLYGDGGVNAAIVIGTTTGDDSTVLSSGTPIVATFTSSGTWVKPGSVTSVTYLIVAGGGGGGDGTNDPNATGGGGGAGGLLTGTDTGLSSSSYAIVVGAGGATNTNGGNSSFNGHTAVGGGAGSNGNNGGSGFSGGSGGGADGAGGSGGAGTGGQGNSGGSASLAIAGGGGGGGAGGAGTNGSFTHGGAGGNGTASSITGVSVTYAGGGGGNGTVSGGSGGTGGGGQAGAGGNPGTAGTNGLGGGGGGGGGYAGGSGVVILSYTPVSITSAGTSPADNQNRLHCWDATNNIVRRTGLPATVAPTAANTGSGSYTATLRYYRVRFIEQSGSALVRRSEGSPSLAFTPSGSGTGVIITRPTAPNENETHWELEESLDNTTFYQLRGFDQGNAVAVATTTALHNSNPSSDIAQPIPISASIGLYTTQKSYKYIAADQNRLLGFGSYNASDPQNTVEVSAIVGSLNIGDAERVDTTTGYQYRLDEADSGVATGLFGPMNGQYYPTKYRQIWQLTPTGVPTNPYQPLAISKRIGCVGPRAAAIAEDEWGRPALYFMSHRGPYRYGANGLEYLGRGVEDLILRGAPNSISVMNLSATNVVAHVAYHADVRQVWFWFATGSSNDPDTKLIWQIGRAQGPSPSDHAIPSGWARHTGPTAAARCSVLFSRTVGSSMSLDLKPYTGNATTSKTIHVCDSTTTNDAGTNFQAYILDKVRIPWTMANRGSVNGTHLTAQAASGVTITQTLNLDYGAQTAQTSSVLLTAAGAETRVQKKFEDSGAQDIGVVQAQWGDASAVSNGWSLEAAVIEWQQQEAR